MIEQRLILQAREVDILSYLHSRGYQTIKTGAREYRLKEHDSLVISNNKWHWFSRDMGGNTLDFLMKYEGKSFSEAVAILTDSSFRENVVNPKEIFVHSPMEKSKDQDIDLVLPPAAKDYHRVFAYLNKTRRMDKEIISALMHQGKIYQSDRNNCVFVGTDKEGKIRFACERGTISGVSYRRDCPGSDKRFCFHMEGQSDKVYVFEAPIDAMSHATLFKMRKVDHTRDHRISLGCLGDAALMQYLGDRPEIRNVVLCLDNDRWGRAASEKFMVMLKDKGYAVSEEFPKNKDFNEYLVELSQAKTLNRVL